jgi:hypothetical protein
MDAETNRGGERSARAGSRFCVVCGGKLDVLVEIPQHSQPYARDHAATQYFCCERCGQIQIVDD